MLNFFHYLLQQIIQYWFFFGTPLSHDALDEIFHLLDENRTCEAIRLYQAEANVTFETALLEIRRLCVSKYIQTLPHLGRE